jgi:hypothetical protein
MLAFLAAGQLSPARAQFLQQGPKLVGTGNIGASSQGTAVALSADGNTAIIGGQTDDSPVQGVFPGNGAAWVFTRSGESWRQQGPKVMGSGAVGLAAQGSAVALSGDGNTALVGGAYDDNSRGSVWAFIRSGGIWTQQGAKLQVSNGITGRLGVSVALSADGNTAILGSESGAAWIFTRTGGLWKEQAKLVGTGMTTPNDPAFGYAVSISADGNTAAVGNFQDNGGVGATWIFTRSGTSGPSRALSWSVPTGLDNPGRVSRSRSPAMAIR